MKVWRKLFALLNESLMAVQFTFMVCAIQSPTMLYLRNKVPSFILVSHTTKEFIIIFMNDWLWRFIFSVTMIKNNFTSRKHMFKSYHLIKTCKSWNLLNYNLSFKGKSYSRNTYHQSWWHFSLLLSYFSLQIVFNIFFI